MRNLLTATVLLLLFSCQKMNPEQEAIESVDQSITATVETTAQIPYHIGDSTKHPNMYIPQHQMGWLGYTFMGLWDAYKRLEKVDTGAVLKYDCVIGNGISEKQEANGFTYLDFDSKANGQPRDFVVDRSADGIQDQYSTNSYNFPGMLRLMLFKDGKLVSSKMKQQFYVENNRERENFPWAAQHYYDGDTMYIFRGCGDNYFNSMPIPSIGGVPINGKYVLKVEVNPDKVITESDYTDNVSFLPFRVDGMTPTTDTTALSLQAPAAAQWIECRELKGKTKGGIPKGVSLKWTNVQCENYCVEKNGRMIKVWYDGTEFIDPTGTKYDTYRIRSNNWGLGNVFNEPKKPVR